MIFIYKHKYVFVALALVLAFFVPPVHADDGDIEIAIPSVGTPDAVNCVVKKNRIMHNITSCIDEYLDVIASDYLSNVSSQIGGVVYWCSVIAIMLFGFRTAMGANLQTGRGEMFGTLIKLVGVAAVSADPQFLLDWHTVVSDLSTNLGNGISASLDTTFDFGLSGADSVFERFDMIIIQFLGLGSACTKLAIAAFALAIFLSGGIGMLVLILVATMIITILFAFLQTALIYITSLIVVTMMLGLTPAILPFIFFEPTKQIVVRWFEFMLVYALQPVFMAAFLSFALILMSLIGERFMDMWSTFCNIIESLGHNVFQELYTATDKVVEDKSWLEAGWDAVTGAAQGVYDTGKYLGSMAINIASRDWMEAIGDTWVKLSIDAPLIIWSAIEGGVRLIVNFVANLFLAITTLMMIIAMLKKLPDFAHSMVGSGSAPRIARGVSQQLEAARSGISKGISKGVTQMSKAKAVRRTPPGAGKR